MVNSPARPNSSRAVSAAMPHNGPDPQGADEGRGTAPAASRPPTAEAGQPDSPSADRLAYSVDEMRRGNLTYLKVGRRLITVTIYSNSSATLPHSPGHQGLLHRSVPSVRLTIWSAPSVDSSKPFQPSSFA